MIKKFKLILLGLFFFKIAYASSIEIDPDRLYCIHASHFLIKNSTAIAGSALNHPQGQYLLPLDHCFEVRKTLHHCIGGLVPEDAMAISSFFGLVSTNGHTATPYMYLDTFSNFLNREEIFAGQMNDLFTTSHTYAAGSIAVIPYTQADQFTNLNPNFQGEVRFYDSCKRNIKEVVDEILTDKNAIKIAYTCISDNKISVPISLYSKLFIDNILIDNNVFIRFFQKYNLPILHHNYSHFSILEQILTLFRETYIDFLEDSENLYLSALPSQHLPAFLALAEFEFQEFFKYAQILNEHQQQDLKKWQKECWNFINLHKLDYELRKENKSLFYKNENFERHLKQRNTLNIEQLRKELKQLNIKDLKEIEDNCLNYKMNGAIPFFYNQILQYSNPLDYIAFNEFMKKKVDNWRLGSGIILINVFNNYDQSEQITQETEHAFNYGLRELDDLSDSDSIKISIKQKFWDVVKLDNSDQGMNVLTFINHPNFNHNFKKLLGFSNEIISFDSLLKISPSTSVLFSNLEDSINDKYEHAIFLKDWFQRKSPTTLQGAMFATDFYIEAAQALETIPLKENLSNKNVLDALKRGYLGTLEQIFTFMKVETEFKQKFSSDESFFQSNDTFASIYRDLKKMKKS